MPKKSFSELIKSDQPVLVDFYADWCQPCHMLAPIVSKVADQLENVKVIKINVDKNKAVSAKYQIRSIPTLMLFHQSKVLWRHSGIMQEKQLLNTVRSYASKI